MLLPLAGRPMLDYLLDRIREVEEIDAIHVVTNSRFAPTFSEWAPAGVTVHDDGTTSNEDRLGAIGDLAFTIERAGLEGEDLLVVAGDNLVGYSLREFVAFWRDKGGSAIAVYEVAESELLKSYGVIELDADDRVVGFEEKPARPRSNLAATAAYLYRAADLELLASVPGRRQPAGCPGELRRLAAHASPGPRVPLHRRVARHRRCPPAAGGGQPPARTGRNARSQRVRRRLTETQPKI